jgi:hypothetical protein
MQRTPSAPTVAACAVCGALDPQLFSAVIERQTRISSVAVRRYARQ